MRYLSVGDTERKAFEKEYDGSIDSGVLLSEDESVLYKCMCFKIKGNETSWHRLILTNKKIISLEQNEVFYLYLNQVEWVCLECANKSNEHDFDYKIRECLEVGNTPYILNVSGREFILNNKDDAMTLLDEINRLMCE